MALYDVFYSGVILLILLFLYYQYAHSYFKKRGVPTVPPTFPFGNISSIIFRKQSINAKIVDVYNALKGHRFGGIYFLTVPVFLPIDVELIRNILVKDFHHFDDRGIHFDEENDPVSAHLFSLYGEKWKKLRAKLSPAFTAGKVKYMFNTIHKCGDIMIEVLENMIRTDNVIEIKDILARYTTDVIGSCGFGIECNSLKNSDAEFRIMGNRAFVHSWGDFIRNAVICASPKLAKVLKLSVFPKHVSIFFKKAVEDTIAFRETHRVTRNDFLQLLIRMLKGETLEEWDEQKLIQEKLTLNEATAQAFIFFLAGFETTSTSMGFTVLELAINPRMQEKARREVFEALGKFDGKITHDAIAELPYMEKILLESLRKYPPAPAYLRRCTKDYIIPGTKIVIPKDMTVLIPTMAVQRDPEYYPNPDVFDPERFSAENRAVSREAAYIPFGAGPRKCIGMRFAMIQTKLALSLLLQNFKFTLSSKTPLPLEMESKGIVLATKSGIWIKLEKYS